MKTSAIAIAGAAALAAFVLVRKRTGDQPANGPKVAGVSEWYLPKEQQSKITQAAINQSWADLEASVFRSQPDFWV